MHVQASEKDDCGKNHRPAQAPLSLDIAIVGAGIGGLAIAYLLGRAGHKVTVYESASHLSDVGAGIQLSPNVTRLLLRWGLGDKLKQTCLVAQEFALRRYDNGELLGWKKLGSNVEKEYGAPYYHIHRADLHQMLLENARKYATIHLNSPIVAVDPSTPSVTLQSGEIIKAQLVLGADGLHSRVRNVVVGTHDNPTPIGDESYRALIPASLIIQDPELKSLMDEGVNCWMGPRKHIVGYCVRRKELYNIVMVHPSRDRNEVTREVDPAIMRNDFTEFEPRIQKLLSMIKSTMVWALMDRKSLDKWVHEEGKVCLVGDACHPMLPYRAQGAAMALEDAAVLGKLLATVSRQSDVAPLLRAYQEIRLPRTDIVQQEARMNRTIFHMDDGPDQERRDRSMRQAMEVAIKEAQGEQGADCAGSENLWGDRRRTDNVFGYDADAAVDQWWKEHPAALAVPKSRL